MLAGECLTMAESQAPDTEKYSLLKLKPAWLLLFIFILLYLIPLGSRPLFIPDETRYAEVPREMLQSGEWLVPHLNGLRYFEKPSMGYWLDAAAINVFGENEFAVRLDSAVATGLTACLVFLLVTASGLGRKPAYISALIYLTCLGIYGTGTFSVLDSLLSLFLTAGISWFYLGVTTTKIRFWILSGIAFSCALMTKGFLAFAIPVLVLTPWLLWLKRYDVILRQSWLVIAITLLIALPWALAMHLREPDFWHYFFWVEHIQRFTATNAQHKAPVYFYLLFFPVVAFPWVSFLPAALHGLKVSPTDSAKNLIRLCGLWIVLPFIFFSVSSGKLITYIMPIFPALAILLGVGINNYLELDQRKLLIRAVKINAAVLLLLLAALTVIEVGKFGSPLFENQTWKFLLIAAALLAGVIVNGLALVEKNPDKLLLYLLLMFVPMLFILNIALPDRVKMSKAPAPLFLQYSNLATANALVITDDSLIQAAAWYLKRNDIYLSDGGELSYGLSYKDGQHKLLDAVKFQQLVANNSNRRPILFYCKAACNPGMVVILDHSRLQTYRYGNFVLLYQPVATGLSATASEKI